MEYDHPRTPNAQEMSEEQAVDFVNHCLAGSYNAEGVTQWWARPRRQLDGQTPQQAWATDRDRVITLAQSVVGPTDQS